MAPKRAMATAATANEVITLFKGTLMTIELTRQELQLTVAALVELGKKAGSEEYDPDLAERLVAKINETLETNSY
jgi:hypothetical protein